MQLLRAWNWVYRVELLHQTDFSLNLSNCGILQLLLKDNQPDLKLSTGFFFILFFLVIILYNIVNNNLNIRSSTNCFNDTSYTWM